NLALTGFFDCFSDGSGGDGTEEASVVTCLHLNGNWCFCQLCSLGLCGFQGACRAGRGCCALGFNFLLRTTGPTNGFAAWDQVVASVTVTYFDDVAGRTEVRDVLGQNDFLICQYLSLLICVWGVYCWLRTTGPRSGFAAWDQVVASVTVTYFDDVAGRTEVRDLLGQNDFLICHDLSPLISV